MLNVREREEGIAKKKKIPELPHRWLTKKGFGIAWGYVGKKEGYWGSFFKLSVRVPVLPRFRSPRINATRWFDLVILKVGNPGRRPRWRVWHYCRPYVLHSIDWIIPTAEELMEQFGGQHFERDAMRLAAQDVARSLEMVCVRGKAA